MSHRSAENLNRLASVAKITLTHLDSFPYDLDIGSPGLGLGIQNNDSSENMIFSLITINNKTIGPFVVSRKGELSEEYPPFKRIEISKPTEEFYITVRGSC